MEKGSTTYLIGTGGWEHEAYDNCFYPVPGEESLEKLRYYCRFFDTVEVRPAFWDDSLTADDARGWIGAVAANPHFLFDVKLHSSFTHKRIMHPNKTRNVRSLLHELAKSDRLGALLIQLPYSFTNTSANRFHLVKLAEIFSGFPVHVELRHESWHQPNLMSFLSENQLHPVSADLPRTRQFMPFITEVVGETAYLRLHGRNERGWLIDEMDTRYDYLYNRRETLELKHRLNALSRKCRRVIVIFNNTTAGKAIANALQLKAALREERTVTVPAATLQAFPGLQDISHPHAAEDSLFGKTYKEAM